MYVRAYALLDCHKKFLDKVALGAVIFVPLYIIL